MGTVNSWKVSEIFRDLVQKKCYVGALMLVGCSNSILNTKNFNHDTSIIIKMKTFIKSIVSLSVLNLLTKKFPTKHLT